MVISDMFAVMRSYNPQVISRTHEAACVADSIREIPGSSDPAVGVAGAIVLRSEERVIVAAGEVIDSDLYVAAGQVIINGTVNGNVLCVGNTITINGTINGSITALSGKAGNPSP